MLKLKRTAAAILAAITLSSLASCGERSDKYDSYDRTGQRYDYDLSEYIAVPDYSAIEIPDITFTPTEEDVENARIIKRAYFAPEESVDEPCQKYDLVDADYSATLEGEDYSLLSSSANPSLRSFMVGVGNFGVKEIDDAIVGMTPGEEKTVEFTLPEPYLKDIPSSGKSGTFTIKLEDVRRQKFPEYNDEFVNKYYGFDSAEEYDAEIAYQITHDVTAGYEGYEKILAWYYLSDNTRVIKYPGDELAETIEEFKEVAKERELDLSDEFIEDYSKNYVKEEMILYFIIRCEGIVLTETDYNNALLEFGSYYEVSDVETCEYMAVKSFGSLEKFKESALLDKARDEIGNMAKKIDTAEYYAKKHAGDYTLTDEEILAQSGRTGDTVFIVILSAVGAAALGFIAVLAVKIAKKKKTK